MDGFEALVRLLLEQEGYWTRQSEKVKLTPEEKAHIKKPSMPRTEIDVIAFKPRENTIIAMEVKSYLDSRGVLAASFNNLAQSAPEGRYKLFTCPNYRQIVFKRLLDEYVQIGLADQQTTVQLGLAAGKIKAGDQIKLGEIFRANDWLLWTPEELALRARKLAQIGYENDPFVLFSKLLVRNPPRQVM